MQRQNLFELQSGLNQFVITQNDLELTSSKIPLLNLPEGLKIKNIFMNIVQPFKSTLAPNQSSIDACVKYRMMIGTIEDTQDFLTWTEEAASVGESNNNTGSYFSSPNANDVISKVILENWVMPRVWSISSNHSILRTYQAGSAGTQTASFLAGGYNGSAYVNSSEEYDGASWSSGGNLNALRGLLSAAGTLTAGLIDGYGSTTCEEYNGTSWANGGSMSLNGRYYPFGGGSQTAALFGDGYIGGTPCNTCEEYNGTAWSSTNGTIIRSDNSSAIGASNAAMLVPGGYNGSSVTSTTQEYNGTVFSLSNEMTRGYYIHGCFGLPTAAGVVQATCEEYDGSSWKRANSPNSSSSYRCGSGSQNSALTCAGSSINTEEYDSINMNEVSLSGEMILNITVI